MLFSLNNFPLQGKTVFLRVDYNVPLEKKEKIKEKYSDESYQVEDNTKIISSLPTIRYLLQNSCKIILATHLGRPDGRFVAELKINPLVIELKRLLPKNKITPLDDCIGREIKEKVENGKPEEIFFLENLRFYQEEEKNNSLFAHSLANLADVYINDAFAVCHRQNASVDAITHFLPSIPGFSLQKEIFHLSTALHPVKPAVWILGGAKLDKINLVAKAMEKADYILVGGAIAFSFLKAKGYPIGMSKIDANSIAVAKKILKKKNSKKIILPIDFIIADKISPLAHTKITPANGITNSEIGLDVGPETIKLFQQYLRKAHTIVWNGPLGYYELAKFAYATKEIARFIGKLTAVSIIGGGETAEAIHKFHLQDRFTHVSTGGGASIAFLSGDKLPGIIALQKNYQKFKNKIG
ncbi:phosphoglycerate kinase [Candidatus Woesearchaeota archaeon]|nr:phosphoglycerate kinase [Candidatus Woesearchaeota archaeon]